MEPRPKAPRRWLPPLVALAPIALLFVLSRQPALSGREAEGLAGRFRFARLPVPGLAGRAQKMVREVHPSLRHISALVSFVGAAVALADLDGDGLPNDLVHVDPRVDLAIVAPVPGTGGRYRPFALNPEPLPFNSATMAPMGSLVGDFDEDGSADILVYYWGRSPVMFLRRGGAATRGPSALARESFAPRELVEPPQRWYTCAVTQADLDGDGHLDLIVGNYFPDGARILDAAAPGVEQMPHSISRAFNGGRNRLFLRDGAAAASSPSCAFREAEGVLGDEVARGWTFAIGAADLDGDLLPEIYFVNDWGPDRLLHNRSRPGAPRFAPLHGERALTTPRSKVLGRDSFNGMGIDFGDLNGDGWPDLFVSNITAPFGLHESHFLFLSTGRVDLMRRGIAPYREASEEVGLSRSGWAWEARLADFDNDGVLEVLQAAGFTKGTINRWPEAQELALANDELISAPRTWPRLEPGDAMSGGDHNPFFVRADDGRYYDLAPGLRLAEPMCSRGIAAADVDGDGRLDLAVANQWGPSYFYRNTAPSPGASLGLDLRLPVGPGPAPATVVRPGRSRADAPSRPAIGAAAVVHLPDGRRLAAQVDGGTGHSGKRSPELHFGLGRVEASATLRVDLRWRDAGGQVRSQALSLGPGWHTVLLGGAPEGRAGGEP
jgi:enediyne biosynthesis protein E4